jgi:diadenylate cyclase
VAPRGLRLLARVPGITAELAAAVVSRFGELAAVQRASAADLTEIPGINIERAFAIKDTLDRLTESVILDQYS